MRTAEISSAGQPPCQGHLHKTRLQAKALSAPHSHPKTLCSLPLAQVTGVTISALRSRERRLESCYAPAIPLGTLVVSDSGSETGAASRVHVWPDAVRYGQLDRAQCSDQRIHPRSGRYSNVCAVRDEEAAGSNPATPTSSEGM